MDEADDTTGQWVSISEAARRLGVTRAAVKGRVRRGTIETRPLGNRGLLVRTPDTVPVPYQEPPPKPLHDTGLAAEIQMLREQLAERDRQLAAERATNARLEAERDGLVARLGDRDKQLDQSRADHAAEIARLTSIIERRDREAERMQLLLQAEQQQGKLLTDQRQHPQIPQNPAGAASSAASGENLTDWYPGLKGIRVDTRHSGAARAIRGLAGPQSRRAPLRGPRPW